MTPQHTTFQPFFNFNMLLTNTDSHGLLPKLTVKPPRENMILEVPDVAGRVEGPGRRLDSPEDGNWLEPGEILVISRTDIGWTLLFPRAGAIVANVSAAAISPGTGRRTGDWNG
jgi:hypothetical protein